MNFDRVTLVILFAVEITAFNLSSLNNIEEIIKFIAGVADSIDGEKIKAAADLVDGFKIDGYQNYGEIIREYFVEQPHMTVTNQEHQKLEGLIRKIDDAWTDFGIKEDLAELLEFGKLLPDILNELYRFYVGNGGYDKGFLYRINTDWRPFCREMTMSLQIRLRKLHQVLILSELRGFILTLKASENPQKSAARAIFHSAQYVIASREGIRGSLKSRSRCDPPHQVRGETYSEFLGLFQGLIINEAQSDVIRDRCPNDCFALDNSRISKCYNDSIDDNIMPRCYLKQCHGKLIECYWIGDVRACELNEGSDRRFQWAQNVAENRFYGSSLNMCDGKIVDFISRLGTSSMFTCNNCMCTCAEIDGNSTAMRTISLIPQVADISRNMVMTGVKLTEKDRMLHLQIEQAQLGLFGEIVPGTEEWKKLGDFEYDSTGEGSFRMKDGDRYIKLVEFVDYSFVTFDQRTINLDQVLTYEGQVLIGARFVFNSKEDAFELQVKSWPVDINTGKLAIENPSDRWIGWQNAPRRSSNYFYFRSECEVGYVNTPLKATDWNNPVSYPNQKLLIRATGYVNDMAQHTVPFLDLQPLTWPDGRVPLEGLEVVYSRASGFGGFLGFRIHGFDFSKDFGWKMPRSYFNKYRPHFEGKLVLQDAF